MTAINSALWTGRPHGQRLPLYVDFWRCEYVPVRGLTLTLPGTDGRVWCEFRFMGGSGVRFVFDFFAPGRHINWCI